LACQRFKPTKKTRSTALSRANARFSWRRRGVGSLATFMTEAGFRSGRRFLVRRSSRSRRRRRSYYLARDSLATRPVSSSCGAHNCLGWTAGSQLVGRIVTRRQESPRWRVTSIGPRVARTVGRQPAIRPTSSPYPLTDLATDGPLNLRENSLQSIFCRTLLVQARRLEILPPAPTWARLSRTAFFKTVSSKAVWGKQDVHQEGF
jgi:hypothetical protein